MTHGRTPTGLDAAQMDKSVQDGFGQFRIHSILLQHMQENGHALGSDLLQYIININIYLIYNISRIISRIIMARANQLILLGEALQAQNGGSAIF
jgi:hypothetical protein